MRYCVVMPRPPLPKHLRRAVMVFTAFRPSEAALIDEIRLRYGIKTRAEVVREAMLAAAAGRRPNWKKSAA